MFDPFQQLNLFLLLPPQVLLLLLPHFYPHYAPSRIATNLLWTQMKLFFICVDLPHFHGYSSKWWSGYALFLWFGLWKLCLLFIYSFLIWEWHGFVCTLLNVEDCAVFLVLLDIDHQFSSLLYSGWLMRKCGKKQLLNVGFFSSYRKKDKNEKLKGQSHLRYSWELYSPAYQFFWDPEVASSPTIPSSFFRSFINENLFYEW